MKVIDRVVTFADGKRKLINGRDIKSHQDADKVFDSLVEQRYISGYMMVYHIDGKGKDR